MSRRRRYFELPTLSEGVRLRLLYKDTATPLRITSAYLHGHGHEIQRHHEAQQPGVADPQATDKPGPVDTFSIVLVVVTLPRGRRGGHPHPCDFGEDLVRSMQEKLLCRPICGLVAASAQRTTNSCWSCLRKLTGHPTHQSTRGVIKSKLVFHMFLLAVHNGVVS